MENDRDKLQRLLDYQLGLDSPEERRATQELISKDKEISTLNAALEGCIKPLASWQDEEPPADLAQRTMARIADYKSAKVMAQASAAIAAGRSSKEIAQAARSAARERTARVTWLLGNLRDMVAVAASITLIFMFFSPTVRHAREIAQRQKCATQLQMAGMAMDNYREDNNGYLPTVNQQPGEVWWAVGKNGSGYNSNTRNIFLLAKEGYMPVEAFLCPGAPRKRTIRINIPPEMLQMMEDFAGRDQINYSFRLILQNENRRMIKSPEAILMSDQNPIFADFDGHKKELDLSNRPALMQVNSPNHKGEGQNVLYIDGRVTFSNGRYVGPGLDDIFTIQSKVRYQGTEQPDTNDVFIAP